MLLKKGDERHVAQENLNVKARDTRVPNQKVVNYKMVLIRLRSSNVGQVKTKTFITTCTSSCH